MIAGSVISIDGEVVPPERATISVLDRGLLYGDGVFEVLRTWRGAPVDLDAHLARLADAAAALQLHVPAELRAWALRTLTVVAMADSRIRIVVTRGPGGVRARLAELRGGHSIVIVEPLLPPTTPPSVTLAVVDAPIGQGQGHGHGMKTLAYLDHLLAREQARQLGADDAIRLDARGEVAECATANLFAVSAGAVATPALDTGALPGIVRARVLALCAATGIPAAARGLTIAELRAADELFVTSSVRGVVPVTALDDAPRVPGPVTARLAAAYVDEMSALAEASRHDLLL